MKHDNTPRAQADEFLCISHEFRLGDLVTESSHPRSAHLSQAAREAADEGLGILFDVDRDVVETYDRWSRSEAPERLAGAARDTLAAGGRLFFTGCGATGRLSIQLDSIWRAFWQDRRRRGLMRPDPDRFEDRTRSVMAGGDYALIKSVEGFEDFAPFGRKQIADLGLGSADTVYAITEGGETSFVIGTAWQGVDAGARVFFVYNNPDDVLRSHVRRSREVIDEPRIEKVNLTTGPMAITGSTRMQATSIELLAMLTVLEMVLRGVLAESGEPSSAAAAADAPGEMRRDLRAVHSRLLDAAFRRDLAAFVASEEAIYRGGARMSYLAGSLGVDVLTDTTERSPTFCTPAFRKWDDEDASESWAFLFTPEPTTGAAWPALLRRAPRTIEWSDEDLEALLDPDAAERQRQVVKEIGPRELLRFRIGLDGLESRPVRAGDGVTAIVGAPDLPLVADRHSTFAEILRTARGRGAQVGLIMVGPPAALEPLAASAAHDAASLRLQLAVPATPFLLDPMSRIGVKMLLNALSTCTMVRLGRVLGNRMIWVVPSNLKLIDRSTRYIRDMAGVSYEEACHALFEVIEYVEPRRRAGKAYPAPVGVATMRLRHGLSLGEAEARLLEELG